MQFEEERLKEEENRLKEERFEWEVTKIFGKVHKKSKRHFLPITKRERGHDLCYLSSPQQGLAVIDNRRNTRRGRENINSRQWMRKRWRNK